MSKTIKINPDLFKIGGKTKTSQNKTQKSLTMKDKKTLSTLVKPNKVKKELLRLIREKQQRDSKKKKQEQEENVESFQSNFNESIDYIQKLIKEKNKQKTLKNQLQKQKPQQMQGGQNVIQSNQHTQPQPSRPSTPVYLEDIDQNTINNPPQLIQINKIDKQVNTSHINPSNLEAIKPIPTQPQPQIEINVDTTDINTHLNITPQIQVPKIYNSQIKPEPPYGCLKGGNKPTYKQYNRTLKRNNIAGKIGFLNNFDQNEERKKREKILSIIDNDILKTSNKSQEIIDRQTKLQDLKNKYGSGTHSRHDKNATLSNRYKKYKIRTIKKKYKLGKYKDKSQVGVLIKNNITRKKVQFETNLLKKTPIPKIKKYLREKNMIKHGSYAPDNVLKQIFVESMLAGDITNKNGDVLLHNYFTKSEF